MLSQAPAVQLQLSRSSSHGGLLLGLGGFNLLVFVMLALHEADPGCLAWLLLLFCCIAVFGARAWWRMPSGTLAWDGSAWRWSAWPQDETCQIQWTLALPACSVLRLTAGRGATQWLITGPAMERQASWAAFRRALIAHMERGHGIAPAQVRAK